MILERHPDYHDPKWEGKGLRFIGYWAMPEDCRAFGASVAGRGSSHFEDFRDRLPNPRDFVDDEWDLGGDERARVLKILKTATTFIQWRGYAECRMCQGHYGTSCQTLDGKYIFPAGFVHYLEVHGVKPPREFIDHVLSLPEPLLRELRTHREDVEALVAEKKRREAGEGCEVRARGECTPASDAASYIKCQRGRTSSGSCVEASDALRDTIERERARHRAALAQFGVVLHVD